MNKLAPLALVLLSGCRLFPSPVEFGKTVLQGTLIYVLVSALLVLAASRAWLRIQRLSPPAMLPVSKADGGLILAHLAVSALAAATGEPLTLDSLGVAFFVACSHMSFSLLVWRVLRRRPIRTASITSVLCLLPALLMIAARSEDVMLMGLMFWGLSGYMGAVPLFLVLLLLLEAIIRRRRGQRASEASIAAAFD